LRGKINELSSLEAAIAIQPDSRGFGELDPAKGFGGKVRPACRPALSQAGVCGSALELTVHGRVRR
jgi:hypothetical protein